MIVNPDSDLLLEVRDFDFEGEAYKYLDRVRTSGVRKRVTARMFKRRMRVDGLVIVKWIVVVREKPR